MESPDAHNSGVRAIRDGRLGTLRWGGYCRFTFDEPTQAVDRLLRGDDDPLQSPGPSFIGGVDLVVVSSGESGRRSLSAPGLHTVTAITFLPKPACPYLSPGAFGRSLLGDWLLAARVGWSDPRRLLLSHYWFQTMEILFVEPMDQEDQTEYRKQQCDGDSAPLRTHIERRVADAIGHYQERSYFESGHLY